MKRYIVHLIIACVRLAVFKGDIDEEMEISRAEKTTADLKSAKHHVFPLITKEFKLEISMF